MALSMNGTIVSFLFFTGLVGVLTWWWTRKDDRGSREGYFLAGRSLAFPFIAGSLLLTNLSMEQLVGLNGAAFTHGFHLMVWEVGAVIALVMMAWCFLPRFLKSGVTTVPEYVEIRYDKQTRAVVDAVFLLAYALILLPILLYTGAKGLSTVLDVGALTGIGSERGVMVFIVVLIGVIGSVYALFGGLRTVAVSDTINGVGLLAGGLLLTYFGLQEVSDGEGVVKGMGMLKEGQAERFNSIGGSDDEVPFVTIFTGVTLLNLFYWCTNQQIIQRTLGAKSLAEGQKGVLLTGGLKLLGPLYLVIPGMIAFALYAEAGVKGDDAYGTLVKNVLPEPLTGFFAAVMVGAILSSFNSALNSTCTIFSLGFYKKMMNPEATDAEVVASGKKFGVVVALVAMLVAPMLLGQDGIFGYLQKMNAIYFIPLLAVVVMGMCTKRVSAFAAKVALAIGFGCFLVGYFLPVGEKPDGGVMTISQGWIQQYHFAALVFVLMLAVMLVLKPRESDFVQKDVGAVDLTPWKHRKLVGGILLGLVALIYVWFADFSVLF